MTILDLMAKYNIELTKQGDLYVGFCVFHKDENRPNFTVYEKTDSWFCYTCSDGGDPIKFLSRIENISRQEATVRFYSDLSSLVKKINKVPEPTPYNEIINLQMSKLCRELLYEKPQALDKVLEVTQKMDEQLSQSNIGRQKAATLVAEITSLLGTIRESV